LISAETVHSVARSAVVLAVLDATVLCVYSVEKLADDVFVLNPVAVKVYSVLKSASMSVDTTLAQVVVASVVIDAVTSVVFSAVVTAEICDSKNTSGRNMAFTDSDGVNRLSAVAVMSLILI
jgi:hypothetical protein